MRLVMTVAYWGLKVKVIGQGQKLVQNCVLQEYLQRRPMGTD